MKRLSLSICLLVAANTSANAAVIVQSISLSATPGFETDAPNVLMGDFGLYDVRFRFWGGNAITPFTLSDGDILETTVTFDAPIEIVDTLGGQPESFFLNIGNSVEPVGGFNASRTHALTGLTGSSGDLTGDPVAFSSTSNFISERADQIVFGNLTNSSLFITGFTLTTTFVSIDPQNVPFESVGVFIVDKASPSPVLLPGALQLCAIGLIGLGAKRRSA